MPSASVKLENQGSQEVLDPFHKVMNLVEKKIRNLEKRKNKLEQYRVDLRAGKELNEDQQQAVNNYDSVLANLELVRELSNQFNNINAEYSKYMKKQLKREQVERQQEEINKLKEVLKVQDVLQQMGQEEVRTDFLAGSNGALQITSETLDNLDLLYKLITPTRPEGQTIADFQGELKGAAEHLHNLLEARNKEVANSTYKELLNVVEEIANCAYPEAKVVPPQEETPVTSDVEGAEYTNGLGEECEEPAAATTPAPAPVDAAITSPVTEGPPPGLTPAVVAPLLSPTLPQEPPSAVPAPTPAAPPVPSHTQDALVAAMAQMSSSGVPGAAQGAAGLPPTPSYFTQAPPPQPQPQPQPTPPQPQQQQPPQQTPLQPPPPPPQLQAISLSDLVSPGSFDFLQESQVAQDPPTVYMDPAVVSIGSIKTEPVVQRSISPVPPPPQPPQPVAPLVPTPTQEPPHPSSIPTQTFTNQSYGVGPYSQGVPVYPSSTVVDSTPNPPPPIPLPPQARTQEKVEFNPEARPWTGPQQVSPQQSTPSLASVQQPPAQPQQPSQPQPQPPSQPPQEDSWGQDIPVNGGDDKWGGNESGNWGDEYDEGQGSGAANGHGGDYDRQRGGYNNRRSRGTFGNRGGYRGGRGNYQNGGRGGYGGYGGGGYRGGRGGMVGGPPRGGRGFRGQGPRGNFRSRGGGGYGGPRGNYQQQQQ